MGFVLFEIYLYQKITLILDVYTYKMLIMKILLIFLIFAISLGTFFLVDSNAIIGPIAPREDPSIPEISVQIVVRNSDGMLVAYIEPSVYAFRNVFLTHKFLDAEEDKTIIIIDDKSYEQIKFEFVEYFTTSMGQVTTYQVWQDGIPGVFYARHDGYISEAGDTLTASWKIIRTLQ